MLNHIQNETLVEKMMELMPPIGSLISWIIDDTHCLTKNGSTVLFRLEPPGESFTQNRRFITRENFFNDIGHIISIAQGKTFKMILTSQGLYCSGSNEYGQLGKKASLHGYDYFPKKVLFDDTIIRVACGDYHTVIQTCDGSLYACGQNSLGQLGIARGINDIDKFTRVVLPYDVRVADIVCSGNSTLIITTKGQLFTSGFHACLQSSSHSIRTVDWRARKPGLVKSLDNHFVTKVACGKFHTLVLTKEGLLFGHGSNETGSLALKMRESDNPVTNFYDDYYTEFKEIPLPQRAIDISCGYDFSVILLENNTILTCGLNSKGRLGRYTQDKNSWQLGEVSVPGTIYSIKSGPFTTIALSDKGVFVWGDHFSYQDCDLREPSEKYCFRFPTLLPIEMGHEEDYIPDSLWDIEKENKQEG